MKRTLITLLSTLFIFGAFGCGEQAATSGTDAATAAPAEEAPVEFMDPKGTDNTMQGSTQTNE